MDKFIFIGIHINHQSPHFTYIAINEENQPIAIDHGDLENLLSYIAGQEKAVLSINAPLKLNTGMLKNSTIIKHHPGKRPNIRLLEYELESYKIEMYHTPNRIERCDKEIKLGIQLNDYLQELGFQLFPAENSSRSFFETPAEAAFWSLIEGTLISKENIFGHMQRQQILYDLDMDVTSPMRFLEEVTRYKLKIGSIPLDLILPVQELNAWVCALTAKKAWENPAALSKLGYEEEGFIYLPAFPPTVEIPEENFQDSLF